MARPLIFLTLNKRNPAIFLPIPISFFVIFVTVISVFSLVSFLCASHQKTKKSHESKEDGPSSSREKRLLSKLNSTISSKALMMVKTVSWKKKMHEGEEEEKEEAVWRKTIMMGERCRPVDFSGKIEYNSEGKLVSDSDGLDQCGKIVPLKIS